MRIAAAALLVLALGGSAGTNAQSTPAQPTPNTWRLPAEAARPAVGLEAAAWLRGQYAGTGLGGEVEQQWLPPRAGSMFATFRSIRDGRTVFSEIVELTQADGTLLLRVKHFTAEFVAWEEKDKHLSFRLVAAEDGELRFDGMTFRRNGTGYTIFIAFRAQDGLREERLEFRRIP
jgi:hypothetical protein